jgi:hypothetical protein
MIKVDARDAQAKLKSISRTLSPVQIRKATARAINHTIAKSRTTVSQEIRSRYNMKAADAKRSMIIRKANVNRQTGELDSASSVTPLSRFNPRETTRSGITTRRVRGTFQSKKGKARPAGTGVTVEIIRGRRTRIPSAFLMFGGRANGAVMARGKYADRNNFEFRRGRGSRINRTGSDTPISGLVSVSVYVASVNARVQARITPKVQADFLARLEHEYTRGLQFGR